MLQRCIGSAASRMLQAWRVISQNINVPSNMRFVYFLSPVFSQGKVKVIKRGLKISEAVNRGRTDNSVQKKKDNRKNNYVHSTTQKIKIMLQILQTSKTEIKPMSFFHITWNTNDSVMRILNINMPASPVKCSVLLPMMSISGIVIRVMMTMIAPIPLVACAAVVPEIPALLKRFTE